MVKTQAETLIHCPAPQVFRFVAEDFVRNYPRWSPEVKRISALSDGPIQVGWTGQQVRIDAGRRSESRFRVTAFEPERCLIFQGISDPYQIDYWFEPVGVQTRVVFVFELQRLKLTLRPFESMIRRVAQDSTERTVSNLKSLIEAERM